MDVERQECGVVVIFVFDFFLIIKVDFVDIEVRVLENSLVEVEGDIKEGDLERVSEKIEFGDEDLVVVQ